MEKNPWFYFPYWLQDCGYSIKLWLWNQIFITFIFIYPQLIKVNTCFVSGFSYFLTSSFEIFVLIQWTCGKQIKQNAFRDFIKVYILLWPQPLPETCHLISYGDLQIRLNSGDNLNHHHCLIYCIMFWPLLVARSKPIGWRVVKGVAWSGGERPSMSICDPGDTSDDIKWSG